MLKIYVSHLFIFLFLASAVGIIIKTSVELAKAKKPPSLTSKETSADFSGNFY